MTCKRRYITADESTKPGYLQRRMAIYRAEVAAKAERDKKAQAKVTPIKEQKAARG